MNTSVDEKVILEAMDKPAFYVQNGKITEINNAAKQYLIPPGEDIRELLITGQQEYKAFTDGSLYLSVSVFGTPWDCTVTRLSDKDLFTLEIVPRHQQLQTMARDSAQFRLPRSDMVVKI